MNESSRGKGLHLFLLIGFVCYLSPPHGSTTHYMLQLTALSIHNLGVIKILALLLDRCYDQDSLADLNGKIDK